MKTLTAVAIAILAVSCQPKKAGPAAAETPATETPAAESKPDATKPETLIGLTLGAAQTAAGAAGLPHRVIEIDGQPQPATRDFIAERLNFAIRDGIVTAVTKG